MAVTEKSIRDIIEELKKDKKVTDQQLDTQIEQPDLPSLADCFENIDDGYLQKMLPSGQQSDVRTRALLSGTKAGMMLALTRWLSSQLKGTFRALIVIVLSVGEKLVAVKIFNYLSKEGSDADVNPNEVPAKEPMAKRTRSGSKSLKIDNLQEVLEALNSASTKWFNIGLKLDLKYAFLDGLESQYKDNDICLRKMLAEVLNTRHVTWSDISDALRVPTVNLIPLADTIQKLYQS